MAIEIKRPSEDRGKNFVVAQFALAVLYFFTPSFFQ
jgi:hypothetical protein